MVGVMNRNLASFTPDVHFTSQSALGYKGPCGGVDEFGDGSHKGPWFYTDSAKAVVTGIVLPRSKARLVVSIRLNRFCRIGSWRFLLNVTSLYGGLVEKGWVG